MTDEETRRAPPISDREAWRQKREARQILLAKVRARRRLALQRKQAVPQASD